MNLERDYPCHPRPFAEFILSGAEGLKVTPDTFNHTPAARQASRRNVGFDFLHESFHRLEFVGEGIPRNFHDNVAYPGVGELDRKSVV